ncbi:MAG: DUF4389 domain-containing protein [Legionellales bacterium]|nr:DUF4389 domain-containing protein [Legionellales bacterium]
MELKMDKGNMISRLIYMVILIVIHTFLRPVIIGVGILQYLHVLIKKSKHPTILSFGHSVAQYTYEIVSYVTFNTEDIPFPFSSWPK